MTLRAQTELRLGNGALFANRRREMLLGALVTATVASLLLAFGPAPGDAPAHLYRTFLVRDGVFVWDNFWYEGHYPLASYSLLYYLPAALFQNLPLVFVAAVVSTMLFASIAHREWGAAAIWPTRVFGVLAAAPLFTGLYSYSLGFTAMLGVLWALQKKRIWVAIGLAALTLGFSPLAFAFLCLILGAVIVAHRRLTRSTVLFGVALVAIASVEVGALLAFPSPGVYPFHGIALFSVLVVSALGTLLARRSHAGAPFAAFFVLWALSSVVAYVVPTPLGDNWTRLSAFIFPLMLMTASLASFRPRRLVVVALAAAFAFNVVPYALLIPYRLDGRPASERFWRPAISFVSRNSGPNFRIEVVPTSSHWESYWLPSAGFPLARGWYRQLDMVDNPILYSKHVDAAQYRHWLRSVAVKYVLIPATHLDPRGGPTEARLVRSSGSGLVLVYRSQNWTIYELPHPTPLLTGPGKATLTHFGHSSIAGQVSKPGRYLLRVHYIPYWKMVGTGCVRHGPAKMTWLELSAAGPFSLTVPDTPTALFDAATDGHKGSCLAPVGPVF